MVTKMWAVPSEAGLTSKEIISHLSTLNELVDETRAELVSLGVISGSAEDQTEYLKAA